jgi:endonuclease YncB( thermonuclease family)
MTSKIADRPMAWLMLAICILLAGCGDAANDAPAASAPTAAAASGTLRAPTVVEPAPAVPTVAPLDPAAMTLPPATPVGAPTRTADLLPDANGVYAGTGEAIEGDVLTIGRTRFLLYGIDTVEPAQTCSINGEVWECWPAVVRALQTILGEGDVHCTRAGTTPDPFGRILAMCEVNGASVNERMVRMGFALAVTEEMPEFAAAEAAARADGVGLWQGNFEDPVAWRTARGIEMRRP